MIYAIYPEGISKATTVIGQYNNTKIKVYPHKCYFERYKIDERYYWFYDEEMIYHIEDSETEKVVVIGIAYSPNKIIEEFLKIQGILTK